MCNYRTCTLATLSLVVGTAKWTAIELCKAFTAKNMVTMLSFKKGAPKFAFQADTTHFHFIRRFARVQVSVVGKNTDDAPVRPFQGGTGEAAKLYDVLVNRNPTFRFGRYLAVATGGPEPSPLFAVELEPDGGTLKAAEHWNFFGQQRSSC